MRLARSFETRTPDPCVWQSDGPAACIAAPPRTVSGAGCRGPRRRRDVRRPSTQRPSARCRRAPDRCRAGPSPVTEGNPCGMYACACAATPCCTTTAGSPCGTRPTAAAVPASRCHSCAGSASRYPKTMRAATVWSSRTACHWSETPAVALRHAAAFEVAVAAVLATQPVGAAHLQQCLAARLLATVKVKKDHQPHAALKLRWILCHDILTTSICRREYLFIHRAPTNVRRADSLR